ncbi:MAG: GNAT family N-acetyltransferase [Pseudomonadota bacterium]
MNFSKILQGTFTDILIRPAISADEKFVNNLRHTLMRPFVEKTWADKKLQERYYQINAFCEKDTYIIIDRHENKKIGAVTIRLENENKRIYFAEFHLQEEKRGIGSRIIKQIFKESSRINYPTEAIVLKENLPAMQKFLRIGAKIYHTDSTHYYIRYTPKSDI